MELGILLKMTSKDVERSKEFTFCLTICSAKPLLHSTRQEQCARPKAWGPKVGVQLSEWTMNLIEQMDALVASASGWAVRFPKRLSKDAVFDEIQSLLDGNPVPGPKEMLQF